MGFRESHRASDTYSKHREMKTTPNRRDLLRLIAEGKRPASQEENKRPIDENGKPLEKQQLASISTPEKPRLLGGMPRGDQASTSGRVRAEDLERMSPSEQVDWCVQGGLAEALGPDGDRALLPAIKNILRNQQINFMARCGILYSIGLYGCASEFKNEIIRRACNKQENSSVRHSALKALGLSECVSEFKNEIIRRACNKQEDPSVRCSALKALGLSGYASEFKNEIIRRACNKQENSSVRHSALKALGLSGCASEFKNEITQIVLNKKESFISIYYSLNALGMTEYSAGFKNEIMQIVRDKQKYSSLRSDALKSLELSGCLADFKNEIIRIACNKQEDYQVRSSALKALAGCLAEFKNETIQIIRDEQEDSRMRIMALNTIKSIRHDTTIIHELMQMRSDPQIDRDMRDKIDGTLIILNNTPSSSEASSSRSTRESRSPERTRSGEGSSAQGGQLIDQMKKILEEHSQMKERENKLKQEAEQRLQRELRAVRQEEQQKLRRELEAQEERIRREEQQKFQQERDRFQRQLTDAREERDQARNELRGTRQELDQARRQLREERQEHNQTQEQLTNAQLERDRFQRQLRDAHQERDQAQRERTLAQEELSQLRTQEEQRRQRWDSLYDILMNAPGQPDQQPERDQSSRGDLRANDALPTTREGMEEQLERERRTRQESLERVLQLQERLQRTLREHGEDLPSNRLNELLRQKIWNVVSDHRLDEVLFPRQQHGELPSLRQRLQGLYLQTVSDYASLRLSQEQIAGEFVDQLQEQIEEHNRPSQEWIDASEDIQELVTGRRPDRTRR